MATTCFFNPVTVQDSLVLTHKTVTEAICNLSQNDKAKLIFYLFKDFIGTNEKDYETLLKLYDEDYVKVIKSIFNRLSV